MRQLAIIVAFFALLSVAQAKAGKLKRTRDCNITCGSLNHPVCGSDDTTYSNKCELRKAKCLASKSGNKLLLHYEGACGKPKKMETASNYKKTKGRKPRNPIQCSKYLKYFPRCKPLNSTQSIFCGNDNVTYTRCTLRIAKCHARVAGKTLWVLHRGACGTQRKRSCPVESQCPNRHRPICGSDGTTYKNLCFFLIAKCHARNQYRRIKLRYRGTCGAPATPKPCPTSCPTTRKPVCGSDGKTYDNGCMLAKTKCALPRGQKRQLRFQYRGRCGARSTPKPCLSFRKCRHRHGGPVCGTDGITYPSKCHFRVVKCQAKRKKRSAIALKHMGRCT